MLTQFYHHQPSLITLDSYISVHDFPKYLKIIRGVPRKDSGTPLNWRFLKMLETQS